MAVAQIGQRRFLRSSRVSPSPSTSSSALTTSSPDTRLMVVLQRSFGGNEYPEQPRNTPVLATRICILRAQVGQGLLVSVGSFGRIPPSPSAVSADSSC